MAGLDLEIMAAQKKERAAVAARKASRHLKLNIRMLDDTPFLALFLHLSSLAQEKEKEKARCGSTQATPFLGRILRSESLFLHPLFHRPLIGTLVEK